MATALERSFSSSRSAPDDNNKVGTFESVLAGIGSGLMKQQQLENLQKF
jgi:hypothetical protein